MMNYKDSLIKYELVVPNAQWVDDGRQDVIITIPLTSLLDQQAKAAFLRGVNTAYNFIVATLNDEAIDTPEKFTEAFKNEVNQWLCVEGE